MQNGPASMECHDSAPPVTERILVMSPHPDDDVISMGGTLARLCQQGHEVCSRLPYAHEYPAGYLLCAIHVVFLCLKRGLPGVQQPASTAMWGVLKQTSRRSFYRYCRCMWRTRRQAALQCMTTMPCAT